VRHRAAIALGSNLRSAYGDREANLREALRRLGKAGTIEAASAFYDTEPVGYLDQPRFLNAAAVLVTALPPIALLHELLAIEKAMGRERLIAKGPRVIDLDLLLYDDRVMNTAELTLPHPEMHLRGFVLEPLNEVAADWVHPVLRISVAEMAERLRPAS
jgi:2-amino-4-hydroxy-6-hydroxymethyldihydropteridine diphosphokinase